MVGDEGSPVAVNIGEQVADRIEWAEVFRPPVVLDAVGISVVDLVYPPITGVLFRRAAYRSSSSRSIAFAIPRT